MKNDILIFILISQKNWTVIELNFNGVDTINIVVELEQNKVYLVLMGNFIGLEYQSYCLLRHPETLQVLRKSRLTFLQTTNPIQSVQFKNNYKISKEGINYLLSSIIFKQLIPTEMFN